MRQTDSQEAKCVWVCIVATALTVAISVSVSQCCVRNDGDLLLLIVLIGWVCGTFVVCAWIAFRCSSQLGRAMASGELEGTPRLKTTRWAGLLFWPALFVGYWLVVMLRR
jgi:hypothetical protein